LFQKLLERIEFPNAAWQETGDAAKDTEPPIQDSAPQGREASSRGQRPIGVNLTPKVMAMWSRIPISTGPEGRQRVAHGVSRGIEGQAAVISAPEGRQRFPRRICRPFRGWEYERRTRSHGLRRGLLSGAAPRLSRSSDLKLTPTGQRPRKRRPPLLPHSPRQRGGVPEARCGDWPGGFTPGYSIHSPSGSTRQPAADLAVLGHGLHTSDQQ